MPVADDIEDERHAPLQLEQGQDLLRLPALRQHDRDVVGREQQHAARRLAVAALVDAKARAADALDVLDHGLAGVVLQRHLELRLGLVAHPRMRRHLVQVGEPGPGQRGGGRRALPGQAHRGEARRGPVAAKPCASVRTLDRRQRHRACDGR